MFLYTSMKTFNQFIAEVSNLGSSLPQQQPQQQPQQPQQPQQRDHIKEGLIDWWNWLIKKNLNGKQLQTIAEAIARAKIGLSPRDQYDLVNNQRRTATQVSG